MSNFEDMDFQLVEEYKTINLDKLVHILSISNNFTTLFGISKELFFPGIDQTD